MIAGRRESGFENAARGENDYIGQAAEVFHVFQEKENIYFVCDICKHI